jgi:HSP20 family protein
MPALTRKGWGADVTPWSELETLGDRMRRWMDYPSFPTFVPSLFKAPLLSETTEWLPAVELVEADGEFMLTAEIPGMSKGDVHISIEDNVLTLKGEKKFEHEEEKNRMYIREREYGTFERSFTLPRNVDSSKIKAEYHDGVVELHMPKGPEAKGRNIEIK